MITSSNGKLLISCDEGYTIKLWSLPEGKHLNTLNVSSSYYTDILLAASHDGKFLVSAGIYENIKIWSLPDGKHFSSFKSHSGKVSAIIINQDSNMLILGSNNNDIEFRSLLDGKHIKTFKASKKKHGGIESFALSPDGKILISGTDIDIAL